METFRDQRPDMQRKPKTNRTYHHGDLKAALLKNALEIIEREGVQALTIREAARRTGVSHTAPYRHFKNKNALLDAAAVEGFELVVQRMAERVQEYPGQPLQQFRACGLAYIEFAANHSAHYRVMFGSGLSEMQPSPELDQAKSASFKQLLDCLKNCQEAGFIRAGDLKSMALSTWSMVHGLVMLIIDGHVGRAGLDAMGQAEMMMQVTEHLYLGLHEFSPPAGLAIK
ncbi:MAG: TetR/AcrR family transcriptional regulator [Proteobacteria bacterium]|nr:TetR/AcrR family transcriptional regulator [Pseudomonadota bacterium]